MQLPLLKRIYSVWPKVFNYRNSLTLLDIVSATKRLSDASLNIKISGSGVSVYQDPPAGTSVEQGSVIRVEFRTVGIDVQ